MKNVIFEKLNNDIRYKEALTACMNCGVCTAICPAAEFYKYDPRTICNIVQSNNFDEIEELLKSETIWYCGQCMSCKTRCPRGNVPGMLITVLRKISQEMGYFVNSEKGRQQLAIKRTVGEHIINAGYCVHPDIVDPDLHPEQGPVWRWFINNIDDVSAKMGAVYHKETAGALRKISNDTLNEIQSIFKVTGGNKLYEQIEEFSSEKAKDFQANADYDYMIKVYTTDSGEHTR
ncbi:4Fe-4S dicluster domain-containing protein [Bacteroidales bacterium OttesenSCG-928-K03]|nr:4Fe-4S dicluster domain-containing protein [Odoribacter sp. OttesenSCG-928-L07]MDL2239109.1 4Fe-4S dicluster domain-containing protein [Bacteroidales bacterium OttesenSCG-928-L14]MDL2240022.1 4Fe-4S dicluster domain-containing protein [Bacteroidales bacterium OttesenSCG-928-K22]MDL2242266.1 4Fe-4S dicluster domain-containing protein [Bacteroidales bacterium OttesenSCG-928-K03]